MSDQRRRRWADIVLMLRNYFVFTGLGQRALERMFFFCAAAPGIQAATGLRQVPVTLLSRLCDPESVVARKNAISHPHSSELTAKKSSRCFRMKT